MNACITSDAVTLFADPYIALADIDRVFWAQDQSQVHWPAHSSQAKRNLRYQFDSVETLTGLEVSN